MSDTIPFSGSILCEATSILGEGPTYDPATNTAWWFNIKGQELHELHLETGRKAVHNLPFLGSVLAVIDPSRQLVATDQGLFVRDAQTGAFGVLATLEDKPGNRSNDGREIRRRRIEASHLHATETTMAGAKRTPGYVLVQDVEEQS